MISKLTEPFEVVLIEDDAGHAQLIRKNLQRAGVVNRITHLPTGKQGLEHLTQSRANGGNVKTVVMLDLNLPDIDGFEILRQLKSEDDTHAMPVIVLSTTDNPRDIDRCYALGCNVFLTKPVAYDDFAEAIRNLGLMLTIVRVPHMTLGRSAPPHAHLT